MRVPRLAAAAVASVLAVLLAGGLAACRADPAVAAYVDGTRITEAQVDETMAGLREVLLGPTDPQAEPEAEAVAQVDARLSALRDRVVEMLILTEAANRYAAQAQVEVAEADPAGLAPAVGLAADHPYVAVVAAHRAVMDALREQVEPVEPSEADQREVYDNLVVAGLTTASFEEVRQVLTGEVLGEVVALRDLLRQVVDAVDIQLNPRYQLTYQIPVRLGEVEVNALGVPLSDPAVITRG
jgi:hypothetical protein